MITTMLTAIAMLECLHDKAVIDGADPDKKNPNRRWHIYDAAVWMGIYILVARLAGHWEYVLIGMVVRLYILQVVLNHMRGKGAKYLGSAGIDRWCNLYIGARLTLVLKTLLFLAAFAYEYFFIHL
jgi:hypothetical protein